MPDKNNKNSKNNRNSKSSSMNSKMKMKGKINYGKYRFFQIVVAVILAVTVSIFITKENYAIPLIAMLIAFVLMYFLKTRVNAVLSDERIEQIAGKSARLVYTVLVVGMALSSVVLVALNEKNPAYQLLGYTFAYIACGAMLLYSAIFRYLYGKED